MVNAKRKNGITTESASGPSRTNYAQLLDDDWRTAVADGDVVVLEYHGLEADRLGRDDRLALCIESYGDGEQFGPVCSIIADDAPIGARVDVHDVLGRGAVLNCLSSESIHTALQRAAECVEQHAEVLALEHALSNEDGELVDGIGPTLVEALLTEFETAEDVLTADREELLEVGNVGPFVVDTIEAATSS